MRIRLLGPMEIVVGDRPVALPGAAERALFALLLLSAGRTVAATSLIDRLWADSSLPLDPMNALQIRVSKLRRALTAVGLDVVHRDGIGYRASIDPEAIDTEEFAARIRDARAAASASGQLTARNLDLYAEALALWRGDPLSDFATEPWATAEAARLRELRGAAITEQTRIALALGRHLEVVGHLEPVVVEDPTNETTAGLLMVALYRTGRQADALEVFARTRSVLDENLGLEPSASLRSLHERVLRQDESLDGHPQQQLVASAIGLVGQPPRAEERAEAPTNLPAVVRTLVGRDDAQDSLRDLVPRSRLVSLVGPGGAGKTTLARATAVGTRACFSDGAVEARLAAVQEPEQVPVAVADALGMSIDGAGAVADIRERIYRFLAGRQMLLLLDNCEHVIDPVAGLVDDILERCPDVTILTTSREALGIPGELQVLVGPLDTAPEGTSATEVTDYAAAQLLLERARAIRSGLDPNDEDLAAVGRICRALDGMPLALELAAARVTTLSFAEIADRLGSRFTLLTTGSRTAEARQQTLRATVDWSYALLDEQEKRVFDRLSVFRGGLTLTAAEAVVGDDAVGTADVLHIIGRLVERSLLVVERGRTTRYGMLETLREYAAEQLAEHGEEGEFARRHAAYYHRFVEETATALRGVGQREALRRLREEHPNIRAALTWLAGPSGELDAALGMAGSLGMFWHQGRHLEGREVLRQLLTHEGAAPTAVAHALQAVSLVERPRACLVHPSPRCAETAARSLEIFDELGDASRAALSRVLLAVEGVTGWASETSQQLLDEAQAQFERDDDAWGQAVIGFVRMETALKQGDEEAAVPIGHETAGAFRQLDDPWGLSAVLYHLGWGLRQFGHYADGARVLEEAIDVATGAGLDNTVQWALADLGVAHLDLGDLESAREAFDRASRASENVGDGAGTLLAEYGYGLLAQLDGDWANARRRYETAAAGFDELTTHVARGLALAGVARCDEAAGGVAAAHQRYDEVLAIGRSSGEPGLAAAAREGLARVAEAEGKNDLAREHRSAAAEQRRSAHRPAPSYERDFLTA